MENKLKFMMAFLFFSLVAHAHGMDELGPHKGYIQMPGPFHTEVLPAKKGVYKIYLLDARFQNPMTTNSGVKAKVKQSRSVELNCKPEGDHFVCSGDQATVPKGQLIITPTRDGIKGNEAVYELPLTLSK